MMDVDDTRPSLHNFLGRRHSAVVVTVSPVGLEVEGLDRGDQQGEIEP